MDKKTFADIFYDTKNKIEDFDIKVSKNCKDFSKKINDFSGKVEVDTKNKVDKIKKDVLTKLGFDKYKK